MLTSPLQYRPQCTAKGVLSQESLVGSLVNSARSSVLVRRAAGRQHWREQYLALVTEDGTVLVDYADLIVREDDGLLVIVD